MYTLLKSFFLTAYSVRKMRTLLFKTRIKQVLNKDVNRTLFLARCLTVSTIMTIFIECHRFLSFIIGSIFQYQLQLIIIFLLYEFSSSIIYILYAYKETTLLLHNITKFLQHIPLYHTNLLQCMAKFLIGEVDTYMLVRIVICIL